MVNRDPSQRAAVVEDDGLVRELLVEALSERGFEVIGCADGLAALTLVESEIALDLLVVDIGLPKVNGRAVAQVAMATRPRLSIILTTGHHEYRLDAGPRMARLGKPFNRNDLFGKLEEFGW